MARHLASRNIISMQAAQQWLVFRAWGISCIIDAMILRLPRLKLVERVEDQRADRPLPAVRFVFVGDALEGGEDVIDVVALDAVKDEVGGIQLRPQLRPLLFFP